ncbi:MAG: glutathione S-transferase N-terminal domain-containing protein [Proteobacteria bacterium]|nr:glutathione S-transferase N-terminal domain-containing protein [Pseudomonadota bacterium]
MLRLYDYLDSGNGYKVRLLLRLLDIPFERVELDIMKGETRTPEFLAKNPNGKIPTLEWDDGRTLAESNAILFHLAEGTPYLPEDAWDRARVLYFVTPAVGAFSQLLATEAFRGTATRGAVEAVLHRQLPVLQPVDCVTQSSSLREPVRRPRPRLTLSPVANVGRCRKRAAAPPRCSDRGSGRWRRPRRC